MDVIKLLLTPIYWIYIFLLDIKIYKKHFIFLKIDTMLFLYYWLSYSISRHNLDISRIASKDELVYGEIPYFSFEKALELIPIKTTDTFMDLGCGKGKLVFYMNNIFKIKSIGVDLVPMYIKYAASLSKRLKLKNIQFENKNILNCDLSQGTIFLITWTCFSDQSRKSLIEKMQKEISPGSHIITTFNPIEENNFKLIKYIRVPFSWGKGYLYIHKKT
jgi:SAM-dependent methyltransferase